MQPIAVVYVEAELFESSKPESSIGIQLEGQEAVYGPKAVIEKLLQSHPGRLRGSHPALVRPKWHKLSVSCKVDN